MAKWNKNTFISSTKENCEPRVQTVIMDLVRFAELDADQVSWGRGEGYGTMTFKCKSDDYGVIPLFHITTKRKIKFKLNYLRQKFRRKDPNMAVSNTFFDSRIKPKLITNHIVTFSGLQKSTLRFVLL